MCHCKRVVCLNSYWLAEWMACDAALCSALQHKLTNKLKTRERARERDTYKLASCIATIAWTLIFRFPLAELVACIVVDINAICKHSDRRSATHQIQMGSAAPWLMKNKRSTSHRSSENDSHQIQERLHQLTSTSSKRRDRKWIDESQINGENLPHGMCPHIAYNALAWCTHRWLPIASAAWSNSLSPCLSHFSFSPSPARSFYLRLHRTRSSRTYILQIVYFIHDTAKAHLFLVYVS